MSDLNWTTKKASKSGWYWWRHDDKEAPKCRVWECGRNQSCLFNLKAGLLVLCSLLFLFSPARSTAGFTGPVVSVLYGDTLQVLHNTHPERVRLSGIDCPEKGQAFGTRAKQAASALVFGKDVILQTHGQHRYGRTFGDVSLRDGAHVNHELGKEGWCWWYRQYAPRNTELARLEKNARGTKKGLWEGQTPIPPWQWRKRTR